MKNWKKPDCWSNIRAYFKAEYMIVILVGILGCMTIGILFYDSWIAGMILSPVSIWFCKLYRKQKEKRERKQLLLEFKELLYALSANLKAGYSMENAWIGAGRDIHTMHPQGSRIEKEISLVAKQISLNVPIEKAVKEFAEKSRLEEIRSFSEVLSTAKRSGGNLVHMMDKTSGIIAEKIEVEQEIETLLSGKRLEQRIMCGMPVFMLLYLKLTNSSYLESLYHNLPGFCIMTVALIGTIVAAYWGSRIVGIEV